MPNFKKYCHLSSLFFVLLLLSASVWAEEAADKPLKAPKFPLKGVWLNEKPEGKNIFAQKVNLVYFWDYTSVNCIREISFLKDFFERYQPYGLQLIFVHAPEFEFAQNKVNVELALSRMKIPFPVYLDNDFKVWEAYKVHAWPTKILVNDKGIIVYQQVGEGNDLDLEDKIREEILKFQPSAVLPEFVFSEEEIQEKYSESLCGPMSVETYMGHKRAGWWGGQIANKPFVKPDEETSFKDRGERVERGFFVEGLWRNREDHFEHSRDTNGLTDYLGLVYVAHEVYAVLNRGLTQANDVRVYVTRDEQPIPIGLRGVDIKEDDIGSTYLNLEDPRLYYLIANEDEEPHEIKLWTQNKGVAFNSFAFSNRCLSDFEHVS